MGEGLGQFIDSFPVVEDLQPAVGGDRVDEPAIGAGAAALMAQPGIGAVDGKVILGYRRLFIAAAAEGHDLAPLSGHYAVTGRARDAAAADDAITAVSVNLQQAVDVFD